MASANGNKTGRNPGQWTLGACKIWREAEPENSRLLEAAIAWEITSGRRAQFADEAVLRKVRQRMDEATDAA